MERWRGRVAIVTGANSGMGNAVTNLFLQNGLKVVGADIRIDLLQSQEDKYKGQLHGIKCDVSNEQDVINVIKWTKENYGGTHVLVNAAGLFMNSPMNALDTEKTKKMFEVNLVGLSIFTREVINDMKANGCDDGHIFNFCSIMGQYIGAIPGTYLYASSKHAVKVISEGLRRELRDAGTKIRVTNISPGVVDTNLYRNAGYSEEKIQEINAKFVQLSPVDVANAVLYSLGTPPHVQVHEITIRPLGEKF